MRSRFLARDSGNTAGMIGFFIILVLLMVLVAAAGAWSSGNWGGPRRRVIYERGPVVERRPRTSLDEEIVEEEWHDAGPAPRSRRVVRRRGL